MDMDNLESGQSSYKKKGHHGSGKKQEPKERGITFEYSDIVAATDIDGASVFAARSKLGMPSVAGVSAINTSVQSGPPSKRGTDNNADEFISVMGTDQNIADFLGDEANYLEVDMGQIDEEERPFMIVDKDTGRVYDMRNDRHVDRLTDVVTTRAGT